MGEDKVFKWPQVGDLFKDKKYERWFRIQEVREKDPLGRNLIGILLGAEVGDTVSYSCDVPTFQVIWNPEKVNGQ